MCGVVAGSRCLGSRWSVFCVGMLIAVTARAASDYQWTFNDDGMNDYRLTSVSSNALFSGSLPAPDPTIALIVGKRYEVTVVNNSLHPLEILAMGGTASSDTVLLAQGSAVGSLENDADIAWADNGAVSNGKVEFTMTQSLLEAMTANAKNPGYRCGVHITMMRGGFEVKGAPIDNPIPEALPKGDITVELETIASGLTAPLGLVEPDDGTGRLFIFDQAGVVIIVSGGAPLATPFLDVSARLVPLGIGGPGTYDERGLLGFALHPDFAANGKVYTYTSEPVSGAADFTLSMTGDFDHQSVIAEWTVDGGNPNLVNPATRRELLRIDQPQFNHNGGAMHFGPDGYLYVALGDGGQADDQGDGHGAGNGQNIETIHGSLLRIDVDGNNSVNGQYGIPADNPFVGAAGIDEIFAYGFRNPYAFSFDSASGDLLAADVGQNDLEEVNLVESGGNYGWNVKEGSFFFNPNGDAAGFVTDEPVNPPAPPNLIDPIAEYDHDEGRAIVGGFVYHGTVSGLAGRYVTGDFGSSFTEPSGRLFYLDESNTLKEFVIGDEDRPLGLWLKGFGQDLEGNVYVCGSTDLGPSGASGVVLKIVQPIDEDADDDGDGLSNGDELALGTDPNNADTDGDGLDDGLEVALGTDAVATDNSADVPAAGVVGFALSAGAVIFLGTYAARRRRPGSREGEQN